jgi:hypothetical protein
MFTNNVLTSALLSTNGSSTFYSDLSANVSDEALAILEGYQTYTGENLQEMNKAIANVDATQNLTRISGDIELTVENTPPFIAISLKYIYNDTSYTGVSFSFKNGQLYTFMDDRSLWVIGNTDVNINESQAINIAQQYVQNYSYTLDNGAVVQGFKVSSIQAALDTYPVDNTTTIDPYWRLQLNLGEIYPGNVYALSIGIWADSGIVFLAQPIGVEGGSPPVTPSAVPSQQTQPQKQAGISTLDISTIASVIVAVTIAGLVIVRKRSK